MLYKVINFFTIINSLSIFINIYQYFKGGDCNNTDSDKIHMCVWQKAFGTKYDDKIR